MADNDKLTSGGVAGSAAQGITPSASQGTGQPSGEPSYDPYSWFGGGGGGYGGGYGGKTPEQAQQETQAQINNTAANYMNRAGDLSDLGTQNLQSIFDQGEQNKSLFNQTRRQNMKQVEWQPNQQREQSTLQALRNRMGNAAYGSSTTDLMEGLARVDDMNDVNLINTWKQNSDTAYSNWFQANEDLISDYIDQMTAIQDEFSKLYSQYWSTMSNINPLLATEENLKKSAAGESVTVGEGTDAYTLPSGIKLEPNEALQALLKVPERASAVNPYTRDYIRPDRAVTAANAIGNTGTRNRSTAANMGYIDNLNVYQRRV